MHVLLVDNKQDCSMYMVNVLESCSYKVTMVEAALPALSTLAKRKEEFDLVLADTNLPDLDAITFLKLTVSMDLPTMLMSENNEDGIAETCLGNGALLFLVKPVSKETVTYLKQDVMWARMRKNNDSQGKDRVGKLTTHQSESRTRSKGKMPVQCVSGCETNKKKRRAATKKKGRGPNFAKGHENIEMETLGCGSVTKKVCTAWTDELHMKFMEAVIWLGEGRCYPQNILEQMNEPGLTRQQVASHLQKCRNDNWRAAVARKPMPPAVQASSSRNGSQPKNSSKKFGSMPFKKSSTHVHPNLRESEEENRGGEMHSSPSNNIMENETGGENMNQLVHSQPCNESEATQNVGLLGPYGVLDFSNPNLDQTKNEKNPKFFYGSEGFSAALNMPYIENYDPTFSDIGSATPAENNFHLSTNQKSPSDDFFDDIPGNMDDLIQSFYRLSEASSTTESSRLEQPAFDIDQLFPNQNCGTNGGQWSAGTSTFGEP